MTHSRSRPTPHAIPVIPEDESSDRINAKVEAALDARGVGDGAGGRSPVDLSQSWLPVTVVASIIGGVIALVWWLGGEHASVQRVDDKAQRAMLVAESAIAANQQTQRDLAEAVERLTADLGNQRMAAAEIRTDLAYIKAMLAEVRTELRRQGTPP